MLQRYLLSMLCLLTLNTATADLPIAHLSVLQVMHLQDYEFGRIDPNYDSSTQHTLCVRNGGNSGYQVTVSSTDNKKQFAMRSSNGNSELPYHVFWSDSVTNPVYVELKPNMPVPMQNASFLPDCGGKDNASLEIKILANELQNVTAGQYNTNLEITVAPI
ncbi:MAG: hypothetical protein K5Q00_02140 [Gammaproteobacteria bacterium]|nr:hypothetical protein [Gammaproteobacteria bacterium]